jgi:uncharacterized membrane protein YhaH (DUF805 family)
MSTPSPSAVTALMAGLAVFWLVAALMFLGLCVLMIAVNWRIAAKAGYSGAWSLLMFVPVVNIIMPVMFAFSRWPIEDEVLRLRSGGGTSTGAALAPQ